MADEPATGTPNPRIRFNYIKSNFFRVVHVDGAIGAVTPHGNIHCAIYNERQAIPQVSEHEITGAEGPLGPSVMIEGKAGFVREVEVDLMMTRDKAVELRQWLSDRIDEYDKLKEDKEQDR